MNSSINRNNGRSIRSVGLFARPDRELALNTAISAKRFLLNNGLEVQLAPEIATYEGDLERGIPIKEMEVDLLVVIGGDGTILKASMENSSEIPILGIKVGTGGFLMEVPPEELIPCLERSLNGDFSLEVCLKIGSSLNGATLPDALNEVLVSSSEPNKVMNSNVSHGKFNYALRSDGLIISTPTGSTAYSLSAGGPILHTKVDGLVVTPLCSLSNTRPMVFSFVDDLDIVLRRNSSPVKVVIDGLHHSTFTSGEKLTIRKSRKRALFVRFEEDYFVKRIRRRLCS